MKNLNCQQTAIAIICTFVICAPSRVYAPLPEAETTKVLPLQPRQPGGYLSNALGTYLTIEDVLYDGNGKVESNWLVVDTDGARRFIKHYS